MTYVCHKQCISNTRRTHYVYLCVLIVLCFCVVLPFYNDSIESFDVLHHPYDHHFAAVVGGSNHTHNSTTGRSATNLTAKFAMMCTRLNRSESLITCLVHVINTTPIIAVRLNASTTRLHGRTNRPTSVNDTWDATTHARSATYQSRVRMPPKIAMTHAASHSRARRAEYCLIHRRPGNSTCWQFLKLSQLYRRSGILFCTIPTGRIPIAVGPGVPP